MFEADQPEAKYRNRQEYVFYTIKDEGLEAEVRMNPHDAMVSCKVSRVENQEGLDKLVAFLRDQNGGKIIIHLPDDCQPDYPYNSVPANVIYVETTDLLGLATRSNVDLLEYTLLQDPEDYADKFVKFSEFKIDHAGFVSQAKIDAGLYSPLAEERKVNQPNVLNFALVDNDEKFVATVMVKVDWDWAYVSDVIVHKDLRREHIATALLEFAFNDVHEKHPEVKHVWLIAGGNGPDEVGGKLKAHFKTKELDQEGFQQLNMAIEFGPPGPLLEKAKGGDGQLGVTTVQITDTTSEVYGAHLSDPEGSFERK